MSYKEKMNEGLAELLREEYGLDVHKVVDFEDVTKSDGYCETCFHEWTECVITYIDGDGDILTYEYYGSFAELIRSIT